MKKLDDFPLRDLSGWINVNMSPNEIDNKQCLTCNGWNFDWNKLVNTSSSALVAWNSTFKTNLSDRKLWGLDLIDSNLYWVASRWTSATSDITQLHKFSLNSSWNMEYIWMLNTSAKRARPNPVFLWSVTTYMLTVSDNAAHSYTATYTSLTTDTLKDIILWFITILDANFSYARYYWNNSEWYDWLNIVPTTSADIISATSWTRMDVYALTNITFVWINSPAKIIKSWNNFIILSSTTNAYYLEYLEKPLSSSNWYCITNYQYNSISIWNNTTYPSIWVSYNWKLVLATWNDNLIYFSRTSSLTSPTLDKDFITYSAWAQRIGWDWKITWMVVWEHWLYVFKEDEIWYSQDIQDDWVAFSFIFNRITNNWAASQSLIEQVEQDIFYFDWRNRKVRRLSYEQNLTTLQDTNVSLDIDWLIMPITKVQKTPLLKFKYPNLKLCLQSSDLWYNDKIFTYNVANKAWVTETTLNNIKWAYKQYYFSSTYDVYEDELYGTYVSTWSFLSKEYDLWDANVLKRLWDFEIYWKITTWVTLTLTLKALNEYWTVIIRTETITWNWFFRKKYDMFNEGQYFQFWLDFTGGSSWLVEINECHFKYKWLKYNVTFT